ncbi:MAG: hypothetical protein SFU85_05430 [Candidatus Methylacidiphilales bacterium]|nr:hypothetical protein [Candidatus Methylacidiphilales bacterium]
MSDRNAVWKVLLGGFLLINPFLLATAPAFFSGTENPYVPAIFYTALGFNVISFWFPLGFTYEVLRRARFATAPQLPDWSFAVLGRFAYEGSVKLLIAVFTLILPVGIWIALCHLVFISILGLPVSMLSLFVPPAMLFVIPFCGVGCCRWLDGASPLDCALNYGENFRLFRKAWKSYLIASIFLTGLNSITTAFFYTIPFAAVFGLCLVDTWFGPIYAATREDESLDPARLRK